MQLDWVSLSQQCRPARRERGYVGGWPCVGAGTRQRHGDASPSANLLPRLHDPSRELVAPSGLCWFTRPKLPLQLFQNRFTLRAALIAQALQQFLGVCSLMRLEIPARLSEASVGAGFLVNLEWGTLKHTNKSAARRQDKPCCLSCPFSGPRRTKAIMLGFHLAEERDVQSVQQVGPITVTNRAD